MTVLFVLFFAMVFGFIGFYWQRKKQNKWKVPSSPFPTEWRSILMENIPYYRSLSSDDKQRFEYKIQEFLLNCKVTGVKTEINLKDKILVASSAIIPIFGFEDWKYINLYEVLIYPTFFNEKFSLDATDRRVSGMVGNGPMEGVMILSKKALELGFKNETDKKNTAIHEFIHLIDKTDGSVDGIPSLLMERQYAIPWLDYINKKIEEIHEGKSDINPYGGTNQAEFFSVASEYFFERPKLLKRKHPKLYALLERVFNQDMASKNLRK
ncbi:M90 family metallopeptidase [Cyclobacterium marinum]|uniref:M90 family metallopeptidase n=1 Tax=Cyclobacterium marinum TaxID=104 RepID=UPI0011EC9127|nr:M90 family metallopeptidase [Cyclobacterium marinum]MBI0397466.1 zinc-dependent peptidase [Cyclobacterium marinum]